MHDELPNQTKPNLSLEVPASAAVLPRSNLFLWSASPRRTGLGCLNWIPSNSSVGFRCGSTDVHCLLPVFERGRLENDHESHHLVCLNIETEEVTEGGYFGHKPGGRQCLQPVRLDGAGGHWGCQGDHMECQLSKC